MLEAEGTAASLAEHEERIAAVLEQVVPVAEISYDLVMDEDMAFVEGSYRLPDPRLAGYKVSCTFEAVAASDRLRTRTLQQTGASSGPSGVHGSPCPPGR